MTQESILKPTDLMIGDWIQFPDGTHRVYSIDGYNISWVSLNAGYHTYEISKLKPINLSSEILEKNGWKNKKSWWYFRSGCDELNILLGNNSTEIEYLNMIYNPEDNAEVNYGSSLEFPRKTFVHELQHIIKLCGIEKEIIL